MLENLIGARAFWTGSFLVLSSCLVCGCEDGRGDGHGGYYGYQPGPGPGYRPYAGAIRFEWSLPGSASANDGGAAGEDDAGAADAGKPSQSACDAIGATQFEALLFDQGTIVAAFQSRCSAGMDTFRVGSNDYTATAALITDNGVPVTETKVIPTFIVAPGETQVIHVAFEKAATP